MMGSKGVVIGVLAGLKGAASMLHAGSPIAFRQNVSGVLGLRTMNGRTPSLGWCWRLH